MTEMNIHVGAVYDTADDVECNKSIVLMNNSNINNVGLSLTYTTWISS